MLFNVNDGIIETTDYKEDVANMNIENFIISALSKIIVRDEKENIYIDENGDLVCKKVTETPQWAPGAVANPVNEGDTGLICVSGRMSSFRHREKSRIFFSGSIDSRGAR